MIDGRIVIEAVKATPPQIRHMVWRRAGPPETRGNAKNPTLTVAPDPLDDPAVARAWRSLYLAADATPPDCHGCPIHARFDHESAITRRCAHYGADFIAWHERTPGMCRRPEDIAQRWISRMLTDSFSRVHGVAGMSEVIYFPWGEGAPWRSISATWDEAERRLIAGTPLGLPYEE